MNVLVFNGGSSSLKYKLVAFSGDAGGSEGRELGGGEADAPGGDYEQGAADAVARCQRQVSGIDVAAHRVVHGGAEFRQAARVDDAVLERLRALKPLDPLHNPFEIALIESTRRLLPGARTVAAFDTAFHATLPEVAWRYALPRGYSDENRLRRYGFHGLSYQYVAARTLAALERPAEGTRLVICHLGSGASVCAVRDGRSVDTSMGLTPLEGLAMGTRSGDVDPGLLVYLLREGKIGVAALDDMLNKRSGLKGLAGIDSGDAREIEAAAGRGSGDARSALDIFCYRVRKYIGAYAAALGGIDALVFTGGIGEASADVRAGCCRELGFLGVRLDAAANGSGLGHSDAARVSADGAGVGVWVVKTDEEIEIARQAYRLVSQ